MDNDGWLRDFESRMREVREKAGKLTERLAVASVTKSTADRSVTVTVGANGALLDIQLGGRAAAFPVAQLAARILDTVRQAQREVAEQVGDTLREFGDDGAIQRQYDLFKPPPAEPPQFG